MAGSTRTSAAGLVEAWPPGFGATLPDGPWLVLHVKPRQEKRLIADLRRLPFPGLCFFERRLRRYPGKGTQESLVPLLSGYLFVSAARDDRPALFATGRLVRIIEVPQPERLTGDLRNLCQLVGAARSPLVVRPELVAGSAVTVTHGTFAGCTGVVQRRERTCELVVNLEMLGQSVAVTLPADFAELARG
jgi:transcription antitermination factor NusG